MSLLLYLKQMRAYKKDIHRQNLNAPYKGQAFKIVKKVHIYVLFNCSLTFFTI
jgi:hypothetical protein